MADKLKWRCRLGLHKWLYVRWPWQPFNSLPFEQGWRGCVYCHKDQRQHFYGHDHYGRCNLGAWKWVDITWPDILSVVKHFPPEMKKRISVVIDHPVTCRVLDIKSK
jgi:hypothetical protein